MSLLSVYKYPLPVRDYPEVMLPVGSKPLTFRFQDGKPFLWCLVDTQKKTREKRVFRFTGTGHPITENARDLNYIGTDMTAEGTIVMHLFEVRPSGGANDLYLSDL